MGAHDENEDDKNRYDGMYGAEEINEIRQNCKVDSEIVNIPEEYK